ncbi:ribose-phosphate diphosphokinase [Nitrosococcus watsonii]|uniref:ribose-phosphate diphosphokinase n=1 Tax=Nitrosococcus watsoni (strain C-113) TaxID=105559 RepID=D8K7K9_NITWC|nr:ribose-phosphate pyrophosphokinase [Nitrosococcus watsonii]ADJ28886.1 ribose-phosphate pyrophosphokinase [Nitrosococcus watsonii C-113]
MSHNDLCLFALGMDITFGQKVSERLGVALSRREEKDFEDGEHKIRPLVNVREKDVFVIQSLYSDSWQSANDKLCRLLFFIGALKDASAKRVTAVLPYLCYTRKDRKTQSRDPVTTRYVAKLLEAVQVDRVLAMDVHNLAAFQNAFNCRTDHLEAKKLFIDYFLTSSNLSESDKVVVVSPDVGGTKRAEQFREALSKALGKEVTVAFMEKQRSGDMVRRGGAMAGEVKNRTAIIIDDLVSTGTTLVRAAEVCQERGANKIYAAVTHGLFVGQANEILAASALEKIIIADTIPPFRLNEKIIKEKLRIVDSASLFADAIQCVHSGNSIVELLEA